MKKLFGVLNVVDIILICVIILAVVMGIYKFTASEREDKKYDNAVLTFVCESAPESVISAVAAGQPTADHMSGAPLGEVVEAAPGSAMVYSPDSQGAMTLSGKPGYKSVSIKTAAHGTRQTNGFLIGDSLYLAGQNLLLRVGDSLLPVYVAEIMYE